MLVSRRALITASSTVATVAALLPLAGCGEDANGVDAVELMKPGAVPDMVLGSADAKVTVIEYSSLGCPHCADFHEKVFPHLKANYIDKGKVRFISRDFPLDSVAMAAAMLARCAPQDKYFDMAGLFFQTQSTWHVSKDVTDALFSVVKQTGFTRDAMETCLKDQKLLDGISSVRQRAGDLFKVNATPTFFVNGKKAESFFTAAEIDATLKPLVG